jgi:hypothetical protein
MRDIKRIHSILEKLEKIWLTVPDYRFGQLCIVYGLAKDDVALWLREDDILEKQLDGINKHKTITKIRSKEKKDSKRSIQKTK